MRDADKRARFEAWYRGNFDGDEPDWSDVDLPLMYECWEAGFDWRDRPVERAARALFVHQVDTVYDEETDQYVCPFCGTHDGKDADGRWFRRKDPEHGPGLICPWGRLREALDREEQSDAE